MPCIRVSALCLKKGGLVAGTLFLLAPVVSFAQAPAPSVDQRAFLDKYCVTCHNQKAKTAGLELDKLDLANVPAVAPVLEKVVEKIRGGMMPPVGLPRPDGTVRDAFVAALEQELDPGYFAKANPG